MHESSTHLSSCYPADTLAELTSTQQTHPDDKTNTYDHARKRHSLGCGAELLVSLDDLVDSLQEILLRHRLPPAPDGIHARLCAHAADVCTCAVGAQPG